MKARLLALTALLASGCATTPPDPASVSAPRLEAHIRAFSNDALEGRAPGTPGDAMAIDYLVSALREAGLQPGFGDSYVQRFQLTEVTTQGAPALEIGGGARLRYEADWVGWTRRQTAETARLLDAELVFVGYGVTAPETGFRQYDGVDMRGKVALILVNDPDFETATGLEGPFGGRAMTYYGRWTYKLEEAARQGAAGALLVHETGPAGYGWDTVVSSWTSASADVSRADRGASLPAVEGWLTREAATALVAKAGFDLDALKREAQQAAFRPRPLGVTVSATIEASVRAIETANVLGVAPGSAQPDEIVLYSAHYDHLGRCTPVGDDDICNGAIDNASGVGALIEIGRGFAAIPARRSVGVLFVGAEESGLLGSQQYVSAPAFPLAKTLALLNVDSLMDFGPTRNVEVVGFGKSTIEDVLVREARKQGRRVDPEPTPERGFYYRSDQFSFAKAGVPALFAAGGLDLVEGGVEQGAAREAEYTAKRYHQAEDEWRPRMDLRGMVEDADLMAAVGRAIADGEDWPRWKPGAEFAAAREASLKAAAAP